MSNANPERTYQFRGGPFHLWVVTLPGPTALDDSSVTAIVVPRGSSIEAGLAWGDVSTLSTENPPCSGSGFAVYKRVEFNVWQYLPFVGQNQGGRP